MSLTYLMQILDWLQYEYFGSFSHRWCAGFPTKRGGINNKREVFEIFLGLQDLSVLIPVFYISGGILNVEDTVQ